MPRFEVQATVSYMDTLIVEADSAEEAKALVESPDFVFDDAEDHTQDADPLVTVTKVEELDWVS